MKRTMIISFLLSLFAVAFPILVSLGSASPYASGASADADEPESAGEENIFRIDSASLSSDDTESSDSDSTDDSITVKVLDGEEVLEMSLGDYLVGVISAEMPAEFEPEALKAQAVAARTYTIYRMFLEPSSAHPEADVCTDFACCKAYSSPDALKEKWGGSYEEYHNKMLSAVTDTDGLCVTYNDEPILSVFHSSSPGMTEDSENVWGGAVPYLKSVDSMEEPDEIPKYTASVTVSSEDFAATITEAYPDADLSGEPDGWFSQTEYTDSGRLYSVNVGGCRIPATSLRSLFGLRSTAISIEVSGDDIVFTTTGYGHGVGMSQYGANSMAEKGYSYDEILSWFYTGTDIRPISELPL